MKEKEIIDWLWEFGYNDRRVKGIAIFSYEQWKVLMESLEEKLWSSYNNN